MTSQPGQQTIALQILSNILRSKGNETMDFGLLIEITWKYLSWNIIPKMWVEKLFLELFLKKTNLNIFLDQ